MGISDRIEGSVENWAGKWGDRFSSWIQAVWAVLVRITVGAFVPPPVQDKLFPKSEDAAQLLRQIILGFVGSIAGALHAGAPQGRLFAYEQDQLIESYRLDILTVINLLRRFPGTYDAMVQDLTDQGVSKERLDALFDATLFYPPPADLVRWQAREVFEPNMVQKYGLDDELGGIEREPFYRGGMSDEQITNYWRAHWEHASWIQVVEMLHRNLITEQDVYDWFRLVEIVPYWRDKMIKTAYTWPTRVDVRRFYDLQTIDEARLREIYQGMGYRDQNLEDYVLWTKIYVRLPDLIARWKNGWITLDQVKSSLVGYGMNATAAQELIETKVKAEEPDPTKEAKQLTKTEIYKGVNLDVLSTSEAIELLMDLDYTEDQARYLLYTNVEALRGSPHNFEEFKALTDAYRKAVGLEVKTMPEELKAAAAEVLQLDQDVQRLKDEVKRYEDQLIGVEPEPAEIILERDARRAELANAEIQLAEARSRYETQLARFHHGEA